MNNEESLEIMFDLGSACRDTIHIRDTCLKAAEEIDRLTKQVKLLQSDLAMAQDANRVARKSGFLNPTVGE